MRRMVVDVSSVCWTSLMAGKDNEFGRDVEFDGKTVRVNSAAFGYENAMSHIVAAMNQVGVRPHQVILVVEGMNSKSLRKMFMPTYKDTRETRPPESYEEFAKLRGMLCDALMSVGASSVTQDGLEADDVIAYLTMNLEGEVYILSRDGDLLQLVGGNVHMVRAGEIDVNTYGPFPMRFVTLRKALVGKPDETPGAYRFGEKAFLDVCAVFGEQGLAALEKLIIEKRIPELAEDVPELKCLQRIIDSEDQVYKSYDVARLYPEKVNTGRKPLVWGVGMVKPLADVQDERLKPYAGRTRLVHAGNYDQAMAWAAPLIQASPFVALDIETSTPPESDEWLAAAKGLDPLSGAEDLGVDVFGSFLVGMSLTFGDNQQYTLYLTHKHRETAEVKNLTLAQMRDAAALIPKSLHTVIQNVSFELPILYTEWGSDWKDDPEWHGFIPNAVDTAVMSSYVDENLPKGLKDNSKLRLGYDQQTFSSVTQITGVKGKLPPGGKLVNECEFEPGLVQQTRRYKMDELTAEHVFHYGCDDTICTAALYNHYRIIMELEGTWATYLEVEQLPAYLTALAYAQGVPVSLQRMKELELEDNATFDKAWSVVRQFLMDKGWDGTVCPEWVAELDVALEPEGSEVRIVSAPADIKEAVLLYTGKELKTSVRKIDRLADAIAEQFPNEPALAAAVRDQDARALTALVKSRFSGEPVLDIDSPKKMQHLLYDVIGIPPRLVNKTTETEREKNKPLAAAVSKWNKILNGSGSAGDMTPEELQLLRKKAKTDAFALRWALKFDATPEQAAILNALQEMATISTRRGLYYGPYRFVRHWKDGLVHANANQCAAVTRRYSFSKPNFQQLPKKGEGIKFREIVLPAFAGGLVGSIDFVGQELRLMAGQSGDANMMACYVGAKKKDIHSITAAGAMSKKWTRAKLKAYEEAFSEGLDNGDGDYSYDLFLRLRRAEDKATAKEADDLRKDAKNVNFAAQFDAQAKKLSEMLTIPLEDAQAFLDAKYAMFPRVESWKEEVRDDLMSKGYVTTMLGARRHLAHAVLSQDKWEAERAGRQGPNFKIQGSAGEMTKLAMARIWRSGVFCQEGARFYFPVHDELVYSTERDLFTEVTRVVHSCMTEPYADLPVPILGAISVGPNFGKQTECNDAYPGDTYAFVAEDVQRIVDQIGV